MNDGINWHKPNELAGFYFYQLNSLTGSFSLSICTLTRNNRIANEIIFQTQRSNQPIKHSSSIKHS